MGQDFDTYHDFASSSLDEIYKPEDLESSLHLTANCLESGIYLNNGDGTFTWQVLPRQVQQSPGYGVVPIDLDADGYLDLAIAQNFFTMQSETGLLRGGMGVVLRGSAEGTFEPMPADASGMVVFGDGKGLAVIDVDHDGRPDLLAMQNNDVPVLMTDAGHHERTYLNVRLTDSEGHAIAADALIVATYADGHTVTRQVMLSTGYLSQSTATIAFGNPPSNSIQSLTIRWPDGQVTTEASLESGQQALILQQPLALPASE